MNSNRCDNLFTYCLMPEAATIEGDVPTVCDRALSKASTNRTNWNDQSIDFTREIVLGLSNGFSLPGISTAWSVSIYTYQFALPGNKLVIIKYDVLSIDIVYVRVNLNHNCVHLKLGKTVDSSSTLCHDCSEVI